MSLSIVIFTHNRPQPLSRALAYYATWGSVIVCDSSDVSQEALVGTAPGVEYQYYPGMKPEHKILQSLQRVSTKYVCLSADDDFLIRSSVLQGMRYLDDHPDYVSVQGQFAAFAFDGSAIAFRNTYPENIGRVVDHAEPEGRVVYAFEYMMHQIYALHRTAALIDAVEMAAGAEHYIHLELDVILCTMILGKHRALDNLWMVRDSARYTVYAHEGDPNIGFPPSFAAYAKTEEYARHQALFVDRLRRVKAMSTSEAEAVLAMAWKFFFKSLHVGSFKRLEREIRKRMPRALKTTLKRLLARRGAAVDQGTPWRVDKDEKWLAAEAEIAQIEQVIHRYPCLPIPLLADRAETDPAQQSA